MRGNRIFARVFLLAFVVSLFCPPLGGVPFTQISALAAVSGTDNSNGEEAGTPVQMVQDPFEKLNRLMFDINDRLYYYALKPASFVYAAYFPPDLRICIKRAFYNFAYPIRCVNCILQGKLEGAGTETARFLINSTIGVAGFFDVAKREFNLTVVHDEDFGQTLGVWGAGPGFYLVIPLVGPTNVRDVLGTIADGFADPLYWLAPTWLAESGIRSGRYVNEFSLRADEYEDFKKAALDPYIAMREGYNQIRQKDIAE
jgi:phospholipid-binding lipoprotein MlaA